VSAPTDLLKEVPLFQSLSRHELEMLARSFRGRTFPAGSQVTTEGQAGVGFFVIEAGSATVSIGGDTRRTLGAGDYFGELALIDEQPRSATIVADSDLRCGGLTSWEFRPLVEQNASIAWSMLQTLAQRLRG
jgi:CRP/FNR family transcriptional regulator, cyclic AMP receptor protein